MSIVAANCPNCGGELQLDDSLTSGYCMFCGTKIIIQEAIQLRKIKIEGRISVNGLSTVENLIIRGKQNLDIGNFLEAKKHYEKAIDIDAENHAAWWGKFNAAFEEIIANNQKGSVFYIGREAFSSRKQVSKEVLIRAGISYRSMKKIDYTMSRVLFINEGFWLSGQRAIAYSSDDTKQEYQNEFDKKRAFYYSLMDYSEKMIKKSIRSRKMQVKGVWALMGAIFILSIAISIIVWMVVLVPGIGLLVLAIILLSKGKKIRLNQIDIVNSPKY